MKTIKTLSIITLTLIMGYLLLLPSCKNAVNPLEGTKKVINYNLIKTKLNFRFYDAGSGELIGNEGAVQVDVNIEGQDKNAVIDITGIGLDNNSAKSSNGFLTLALNPNNEFVPTQENPITFTLIAHLNGYITTSKPIIISEENTYEYRIDMVNLTNPPNGVSVKQQNNVANVNNGVINQTLSISSPDGNASITIKEGTVIKDNEGNPLNGTLNVMLAYFDNTIDASLQAFPGGLTPLVNQGGTQSRGVFYSAGFVAVEITDASGNQAATFEENSVTLKMTVNDETYNPVTQTQAVAGDVVPVYSYEPETGVWNFEQNVTIGENSKGLLVSLELNHLSFWNFDWFDQTTCFTGINIHVNINENVCGCVFVEGIMRKAADNSFLSWVGFYACDGEDVSFWNAPGGLPVYIDWGTMGCSGAAPVVLPPQLLIPDLCEQTTYTIDITRNNPSATIIVDFSAYCANNPDIIIRPSFGAWYRPVGTWCWQYATMINGYSEICGVEVGTEYVVAVYFNGEWYQENVLVDQSEYIYLDMELPADICDEVFGL